VSHSFAPGAPEQLGLRERKKLRTKAQLAEAALRLFSERGFEEVTIEDIAAEVEVSPRTFFRYFASKEDVLFLDLDASFTLILEALAERPAGEPDAVALREAVLSMARRPEVDSGEALERASVIMRTPSLLAHAAGRQTAWETALARTLAERRGSASEPDLEDRVLAACAIAALRIASGVWIEDGGTGSLPDLVEEALGRLEAGFGHPPR
jgi:AcrR family transcriptional regulator